MPPHHATNDRHSFLVVRRREQRLGPHKRQRQPLRRRRVQRQRGARQIAVRSIVVRVVPGVDQPASQARLQSAQFPRHPPALVQAQRRAPPGAAVVHHQRHVRHDPAAVRRHPAGAAQVSAQQHHVLQQPLRHPRVRTRLEFDVEHHAGAGGPAGTGLEGRPPGQVGPPDAQAARDVLRRQAFQAVEVQVAHPGVAEQADEVRDHAAVREQPLAGFVAVLDPSCHGRHCAPQTAWCDTAMG